MKTTLLTLLALTITIFSFGQAPEAFKYQAVVRDAGGVILANQTVGYQLKILQGSPSGTAVYTETFAPTTNGYGLVDLEIGTGTTSDDFSTIDWANGPFYMETALDVNGGTSYAVMGTSQLLSVPYALYAKTSGSSTPGPQGPAGNDGADGLSAYETWLALGNTGTETDFINSLTGPQGPQGPQGPAGNDGATGPQGPQGIQGPAGNDGADGLSAYETWLALGNTGTETDFINSLTGPQGPQGPQGPAGNDGATGPQGPQGIQGPAGNDGADGADGLSAYENWLALGNTGTETDFINSLTGPQGPQGPAGNDGATGPQGPQGIQGNNGAQGPQGIQGVPGTNGTNGTNGTDGLSAYEVWLGLGNTGTEADFINSLTGPQGPQGPQGPAGNDGQGGVTSAGSNITVTGTGTVGDPYVVSATDNVDDDDADPNNELQALSLSNDTLYLTNGGNVYLGGLSSGGGSFDFNNDSLLSSYSLNWTSGKAIDTILSYDVTVSSGAVLMLWGNSTPFVNPTNQSQVGNVYIEITDPLSNTSTVVSNNFWLLSSTNSREPKSLFKIYNAETTGTYTIRLIGERTNSSTSTGIWWSNRLSIDIMD